jgi:LmbE family N-acetylglucosaminyl deacetylase
MNAPEELTGRTLVVVPHPDDETIGSGVLLQRIQEPIVVFATDGAPRDEFFWGKAGSRLRYARARQEEARLALASAGVNEIIFLAEIAYAPEMFVDQELYKWVGEAVDDIGSMIQRYRPNALLTTAYEGGHPDHDACSFVTSVLARQYALRTWEFPLYHRRHASELVFQRFVVPGEQEEAVLEPTPDELETKQQMIAAYASQHPFLLEFDPGVERFRRQPAYDYLQPPHAGKLNYEAWEWPVTGKQICESFAAFLAERRRRVV